MSATTLDDALMIEAEAKIIELRQERDQARQEVADLREALRAAQASEAELLEALKGLVADFDDYPTHDHILQRLIATARAAISKAEGRP